MKKILNHIISSMLIVSLLMPFCVINIYAAENILYESSNTLNLSESNKSFSFKTEGFSEFDNVYLEITYDDPKTAIEDGKVTSGYGWFYVEYIGADGVVLETEKVYLKGSGEEQNTVILLDGADFSDDTKDYHIDIRVCKKVSSPTTYQYSKYPVTIKNIKAYTDGVKAPFSGEIVSNKTGNIFFDSGVLKMCLNATNLSDTTENVNLTYKVYNYGKSEELESLTEYSSGSIEAQTFLPGETKNIDFTIEDLKFGTYKLEITLTADGIKKIYETEFSMCRSSDEQNYNIGLATHFARMNESQQEGAFYSDVDSTMRLMQKAGFGIVREGMGWPEYESGTGEYRISPKYRIVLDAIAKYNMDSIMTVGGGGTWSEMSRYTALYDEGGNMGTLIPEESKNDRFKTYIKKLLNEEKVKNTVDIIEIVNEPELKFVSYDGGFRRANDYQNDDEFLKAAAKSYANVIDVTVEAVDEVNTENGTDYKTAAFSTSGGFGGVSNFHDYYIDYVLDALKNNNYSMSDFIATHPYCGFSDPEPGHFGEESVKNETAVKDGFSYKSKGSAADSLSYRLDYFKGLVTGESVYDPEQNKNVNVTGKKTGQSYDFAVEDAMIHTELGYSSALYKKTGDIQAIGSEYKQACRNIRVANVARAHNNKDKLCFYVFTDTEDNLVEEQAGYGFVKSANYRVPYAAKQTFVAMSAMNDLVFDKEIVNMHEFSDFGFVTEYKSDYSGETVLSLWSTKEEGGNLTKSALVSELGGTFGTPRYYDIFGNEIEESGVLENNTYKLTEEPFYMVFGGDTENEVKLYLADNNGNIVNSEISFDKLLEGLGEEYYISSVTDEATTPYTLIIAEYENGRLVNVATKERSGEVYKKNYYTKDKANLSVSNPTESVYEFKERATQGKTVIEFDISSEGLEDWDFCLLSEANFPEDETKVASITPDNKFRKWIEETDKEKRKLIGVSGGKLVAYEHNDFLDLENVSKTDICDILEGWSKVKITLDFDTQKYTVEYNGEAIEKSFSELNRKYVAADSAYLEGGAGADSAYTKIPQNPTSNFALVNEPSTSGYKTRYAISYCYGIKGIGLYGDGAEIKNLRVLNSDRYNLNLNFDALDISNLSDKKVSEAVENSTLLYYPYLAHKYPSYKLGLSKVSGKNALVNAEDKALSIKPTQYNMEEFGIPLNTPIDAGVPYVAEMDFMLSFNPSDATNYLSFFMDFADKNEFMTHSLHPSYRTAVWGIGKSSNVAGITLPRETGVISWSPNQASILKDTWYHMNIEVVPENTETFYKIEITDSTKTVFEKEYSIKKTPTALYGLIFGYYDTKVKGITIDNLTVCKKELKDIKSDEAYEEILEPIGNSAKELKIFALENGTIRPLTEALYYK